MSDDATNEIPAVSSTSEPFRCPRLVAPSGEVVEMPAEEGAPYVVHFGAFNAIDAAHMAAIDCGRASCSWCHPQPHPGCPACNRTGSTHDHGVAT